MRQSDRWVTPGVIITVLFLATVVVLALVGVTAWLVSQGHDPSPVMDVVPGLVAAATGLITVGLSLATRAGVAKTERNTGQLEKSAATLADAVFEVADAMPRPRPANRHADPDDTLMFQSRGGGAAPAPHGS